MPALGPQARSKAYTPLSDENNIPVEMASPVLSQNGTIVYSKRLARTSSTYSGTSAGSSEDARVQAGQYRAGSEETLSARHDRKGKGKEVLVDERRVTNSKGKERARDLEQGPLEEMQESYPPVNGEEEEERRVQQVSQPLGQC